MANTLQRLKEFIDLQPFTLSSFEKFVGFSNGSLASQIKNNKTIGVDKIEHILRLFPNLSANWLFTGEGEMFKTEYVSPISSKEERKNFTRHQNAVKALTKAPKGEIKITPRQRFMIDDHFEKLIADLKGLSGELENIFISLEQFESLRDFSDEFSNVYTDNFFTALFETNKYLDGTRFRYDDYKKDVLIELEKLKDFSKPLIKFMSSYNEFLSKIQPYDTKKILGTYVKS